jgi:hypothetical protein
MGPYRNGTLSRKAVSADGSFAARSASATVASREAFRAVRPNSTRQRKTMLVAMPWRRQTCATLTPGFSVSCTIARFCPSLKRRSDSVTKRFRMEPGRRIGRVATGVS